MFTEETIIKLQQGKNKIHLLKLTDGEDITYQVRVNRKRIQTSQNEYLMRKLFARYCNSQILQLDIFNKIQEQKDYVGKLVILDYSKVYGYQAKFSLTDNEAEKMIKDLRLIKDPDETYLPAWYTQDRWENFISKIKK